MHRVILREIDAGYTPTPLEDMTPLRMRGYHGAMDVVAQVSPEGGRMTVTRTKLSKSRRVFLSPAWDRHAQRSLRRLLTDSHNASPRADGFDVFDPKSRSASLWDVS